MKKERQAKIKNFTALIRMFIFISFIIMTGCKTNTENEEKEVKEDLSKIEFDTEFPELQNVSNLKNTMFIPCLETSFDNKTNAIYAATLCMAWKEIQDTIGSPLASCENNDLALMTNSKTYQNVLLPNEYKTSIEVSLNPNTNFRTIRAEAYFKKELPFLYPLIKFDDGISFKGDKISAFGFFTDGPAKILYYKNDNDFAIKLYPKDPEHEIILIKTSFPKEIVINDEIEKLETQTKSFKESYTSQNGWKYYFYDGDIVKIPIISFHLDHSFEDIIGSRFYLENGIPFEVVKFYQKNAFILNEIGAKVESYADEVVEEAVEEEPEEVKPKNLIFDKSYIVLLKRKKSQFPYFAMYVANSELMVKESGK